MTIGSPEVHRGAINLEPERYLSGWRPEAGALFLPALSHGRVGDEAAIRIALAGRAMTATVFGTIALVRRMGRPSLPPGVELALDPMSLPAARFLALAARGEKVAFHERALRWAFTHRLVAISGGSTREMTTHNVSEGGCALSWIGQPPAVGEVVTLKLGHGLFAGRASAVVCWAAPEAAHRHCVGVRVLAESRAPKAWRELATDAARSSARSG